MTKLFVTYEIALKLEKLSFDELCLAIYRNYGDADFGVTLISESIKIQGTQSCTGYCATDKTMLCLAPTWDQAIEWLQVNHKILISRESLNSWIVTGAFNPIQVLTKEGAVLTALNNIGNVYSGNELNTNGMKVWKHKTNKRMFLQQSYRWKDQLTLIDETNDRDIVCTFKATMFDYSAWTPMTYQEYTSIKSNYKEIYKT